MEDLSTYDKSIWEKIKDFIVDLIKKIKKAYAELSPNSQAAKVLKETVDDMSELQRLWAEGVREAGERTRKAGVKAEVRENGNIVYSVGEEKLKNATELSEVDLRVLLESAQYGVLDDGTYIPLRRNTPEFFVEVVRDHSKGKQMVRDYPMAATVEHLRQNMEEVDGKSYGEKRPHELSTDDIVTISRKMGDPAYIVLQKNGRYAEIVSYYDSKKKKEVVVSIDIADSNSKPPKNYKDSVYMNGYKGGYYNIIVTQYELDDLPSYLNSNTVVYDKKKTNGKYQVGSGRIVTVAHDTPFVEDIVPQPDEKVKRKFSISENSSDTAYLSAVERGDMETAQRMVDEAAKAAGYINLYYHGAKKGGGFTVFRDWSYFTENRAYAERYTDREKPESLYKTYVKMDKPFDTRKAKDRKLFAEIRDEYGLGEIQDTGLPDWTDGYDISDYIDENDLDYDGIILDEGGDLVNGEPISRVLSYVVRKSAQIKTADPVTYDDAGNVIPLSERFKETKSDIRYSIEEPADDAPFEAAVKRMESDEEARAKAKEAEAEGDEITDVYEFENNKGVSDTKKGSSWETPLCINLHQLLRPPSRFQQACPDNALDQIQRGADDEHRKQGQIGQPRQKEGRGDADSPHEGAVKEEGDEGLTARAEGEITVVSKGFKGHHAGAYRNEGGRQSFDLVGGVVEHGKQGRADHHDARYHGADHHGEGDDLAVGVLGFFNVARTQLVADENGQRRAQRDKDDVEKVCDRGAHVDGVDSRHAAGGITLVQQRHTRRPQKFVAQEGQTLDDDAAAKLRRDLERTVNAFNERNFLTIGVGPDHHDSQFDEASHDRA